MKRLFGKMGIFVELVINQNGLIEWRSHKRNDYLGFLSCEQNIIVN